MLLVLSVCGVGRGERENIARLELKTCERIKSSADRADRITKVQRP